MKEFKNATIVKKANLYFEGKVSSRTVFLENGEKVTLGIMLPGEYEFGTGDKEVMEMLSGTMQVYLPGDIDWITVSEGDKFEVPANSKFQIKTDELIDYCCSYIKG